MEINIKHTCPSNEDLVPHLFVDLVDLELRRRLVHGAHGPLEVLPEV